MAKKKEFKTIKQRAKEFVDKIKIEKVDQYNYRMKEWLSDGDVIKAFRILSHFISIPKQILNETEIAMFDESLFEEINVSKKE